MDSAELEGRSAPALDVKTQSEYFADPWFAKMRSGWKLQVYATAK
jgi:hypothetical protein